MPISLLQEEGGGGTESGDALVDAGLALVGNDDLHVEAAVLKSEAVVGVIDAETATDALGLLEP